MRLFAMILLTLLVIGGCGHQPPTGIPPRDATLSELSPFDGMWQLVPSDPGDGSIPFETITISGSGQRATVDHPNAVVSEIRGEYLNSGVSQFVDLTISVALGTERYELVMRRPDAPGALMSGRLSGDGIEGSQMVRVSPADDATD